jgi:hypothetical protein
MHLKTFALLLVSHVLGDVVIASYTLAIRKRNAGVLPQALAIGFHSAVHAFLAGSLLFPFGGPWWQAALLVLAIHFLIDFTRCRVEIALYGAGRLYVTRSELFAWVAGKAADKDKMNLKNLWPWLLIHSLDQLGHLLSLVGISLIG